MDNTYHFSVTAILNGKRASQSGLVIAPNLATAVQRVTNRFSYCELVDLDIKRKSEGVELFLYGDGFQTKDMAAKVNKSCSCDDGCHCHCHETKSEKPYKGNEIPKKSIDVDVDVKNQFNDLTEILNSLFPLG